MRGIPLDQKIAAFSADRGPKAPADEFFALLDERIKAQADPGGSYVARLLDGGVDRVARKVGEEATEVVIAAKNADRDEIARELADLWFHTFVLLAQQGMAPEDVWDELRRRRRH